MPRHNWISVLFTSLVLGGWVLAQSGSKGVATPPAPASPTVAAKGAVPVIMFTLWRDPREGAFTVNVPQGWQVSGGTSRNASVDPRQAVRANSPDGQIQILIGEPSLMPNQVPDRMTQFAGLREGQITRGAWGGPVRLARQQSGEQFARSYIAWKLCRTPRITRSGLLQAASNELSMRAAAYGRAAGIPARASVGEASFQCAGQTGYVRASTVLTGPMMGSGAQGWDVLELSGFVVANPTQESLARYVLNNMVGSLQPDPQWEARQAQTTRNVTATVLRAQQQMAASIAQHAREQARSNQVDVMSGWERRNKQRDAVMQRGSDVRRGVTTAEDPIQGSRTVSNDSNYYWTRPDGSIAGTMTDTPPDYSSGWRMMTTH